jgi:hypothetical protein
LLDFQLIKVLIDYPHGLAAQTIPHHGVQRGKSV